MPGDIESLSTLALSILTVALAIFNWRLASDTHTALDIAREEFKLSQEQAKIAQAQFETEWQPDIRIADFNISGDRVEFHIANLARSAALVRQVKIGIGGHTGLEPQDIAEYPLPLLVKAGEIGTERLIKHRLQDYASLHLTQPGKEGTWQVTMSLALIYDSGGRRNVISEWFHCTFRFYYQRGADKLLLELTEIETR
jgi:hypothetical protein